MTEENKKRINKLMIPFTRRTLSFLTAATILATGTVGCKEKEENDKDNSSIISSMSDEEITSSDNKFIVDDNNSSTNNETSKNEQNTNNTVSNNTTPNNKNNSTNNNSSNKNNSTNSSDNHKNNSSGTSSPSVSVPSETPSVPTMPTTLTAENINDVEVFKHFAGELKQEVGGNLFVYNDKFVNTEIGSRVTFAILNHQYLTNETMKNLFGDLTLEEFQSGGDFIITMISKTLNNGKKYSYNNFCLDKNIGDYLMEVQEVFVRNDQQEMIDVFRNFYLKDNKVKYEMNFWVDNYMRRIFNMRIDFNNLNDPELSQAFINSSSSITEYSNKTTNIYNNFHSKVKIIN